MTTTERTWTETGEQLLDRDRATREGHNWCTREAISDGIAALEWQDIAEVTSLPMSPGLAIQKLIADLPLRRVEAIAIGGVTCHCDVEHATGAYSLYGLRNRYADGAAEIFVVDRGTDLLVVASDFPAPDRMFHVQQEDQRV